MSKKEKREAKATNAVKYSTKKEEGGIGLSVAEVEILSRLHKAKGRPPVAYLAKHTKLPPQDFVEALLNLANIDFVKLSDHARQQLPSVVEEACVAAKQITARKKKKAKSNIIAKVSKAETKEHKKDPTQERVLIAHVRIKKDGLVWIEKRKRQARKECAPA